MRRKPRRVPRCLVTCATIGRIGLGPTAATQAKEATPLVDSLVLCQDALLTIMRRSEPETWECQLPLLASDSSRELDRAFLRAIHQTGLELS